MKVGDVVCQGDRLIKMKGREPSKTLGVVIEMSQKDADLIPEKWRKWLGESQVTVLWSNGRITESMAENSLEVICESK
jgi:hypothetical protein